MLHMLHMLHSSEILSPDWTLCTISDLLLQQLEAANLHLKKQAEILDQQASVERDRRVAMLKAENARLAKSMNGDIGGAKSRMLRHTVGFNLIQRTVRGRH